MGKKEKLIDSAQKFFQKGQVDKAIKDYQEAVSLDTSDVKVRQRLGELLVRVSRNDEARVELEAVGKNFTANGFYLKAIAVYKQIEKLFPNDVQIILSLASLNEKHGLLSNAMAEYKRAYDYYERTGNTADAVKVLESMQRAEPQNTNIRLKLAEVLHQTGKKNEALEVFTALAGLLVEKRDETAFTKLTARMQQLFPDQPDFAVNAIQAQIQDGNAEQAVIMLQGMLKVDARNQKVWSLVIEAYNRLDNQPRLKMACQHFLKFFPDALLPKEQLVRCLILEKNYDESIELLEKIEDNFISSQRADTLKELYIALCELAPIDVRVLKGVVRSSRAAGDEKCAEEYSSKIASLSAVGSVKPASAPVEAEESPIVPELSVPELDEPDMADVGVPLDSGFELEHTSLVQPEPVKQAQAMETKTAAKIPEITLPMEDENDSVDLSGMYEIEVDFEEEPASVEPPPAEDTGGNWFDTVSDIFDNIATETGGVRIKEEIGDSQAHYDLGLAFKEMGLYDEAINALRQAAEDPARKYECMILQGACLREKGDMLLAESVLKTLLEAPNLTVEDTCAIQYELALTLLASGKGAAATALFCEIDKKLPSFRDVKSRIKQSSDDEFDFNEDDLLDFDLK